MTHLLRTAGEPAFDQSMERHGVRWLNSAAKGGTLQTLLVDRPAARAEVERILWAGSGLERELLEIEVTRAWLDRKSRLFLPMASPAPAVAFSSSAITSRCSACIVHQKYSLVFFSRHLSPRQTPY